MLEKYANAASSKSTTREDLVKLVSGEVMFLGVDVFDGLCEVGCLGVCV